jgi:hypothetical protein
MVLASSIMPRTTLNIDGSVLRELKVLSEKQRRPVGQLASELLAGALRSTERGSATPPPFVMPTFSGGRPLVDLDDKEAVRRAMEDEFHR